MDTPAAGRVAVMSIHPRYAEAILSGQKRVEFRKRRLAPDVTTVLVYATQPVGVLVGRLSRFPLNFGGGRCDRQAAITGSS